ncbi:MAG: hypothetical protein AABZ34_12810 [Nitrospirota bacterium]
MRADIGPWRTALGIVFWSGVVVVILGMFDPTWSAPEPSNPAGQDQSAAPPEASHSPGKGTEGRGLGNHPMRKACAEDVKKLCQGVKAGEGRIIQCLKEHRQEVSQSCSEMMQQRGKQRQ